jgi:hypothetical protein
MTEESTPDVDPSESIVFDRDQELLSEEGEIEGSGFRNSRQYWYSVALVFEQSGLKSRNLCFKAVLVRGGYTNKQRVSRSLYLAVPESLVLAVADSVRSCTGLRVKHIPEQTDDFCYYRVPTPEGGPRNFGIVEGGTLVGQDVTKVACRQGEGLGGWCEATAVLSQYTGTKNRFSRKGLWTLRFIAHAFAVSRFEAVDGPIKDRLRTPEQEEEDAKAKLWAVEEEDMTWWET